MNTATATENYAAGYAAAQATIAIIEPLMSAEELRRVTVQNIIPIHHRDRTDYDHGASDCWADYQAKQSSQRRAARWGR